MKNKNSGNQDEAFRKFLKEWKTDAFLPPRFQEAVWRRIERSEPVRTESAPSLWSVVVHWIGATLPRPALAASYLAILLTIGVTAGWAQAQRETARVKSELGDRYVRVLDPYQTPRQ